MRREIARVVAAGASLGPDSERATTDALVTTQVRCAVFAGERYCLGVGWTSRTEAEVRARMATAATTAAAPDRRRDHRGPRRRWRCCAPPPPGPSPPGSPPSVRSSPTRPGPSGKVVALRQELALGQHGRRFPRKAKIMQPDRTIAQTHSWWCGPATLQMIAWGWRHEREPQRFWADKLGTTTNGSAIGSIVRQVNRKTGYDGRRRAGPYVVLDISDLGYRRWFRLTKKHIADYRAPIVLHPELLARFYPYLDDDASGHFQVGRGYKDKRNGIEKIGFFEPWNQQAFDPSEPFIDRVQWRSAYRSYRANLAHPMQNMGV